MVSAPDALGHSSTRNFTGVGDLAVTPRILLAEDRGYTITTNLYVRTPIGDPRNGNGVASLSPDVEFWANPTDGWVIRGAVGVTVPTNWTAAQASLWRVNPWSGFNASPGPFSSFDARLAVGQYITSADARLFKSFVYYLSAMFHTEISGGRSTDFSLTPGLRFGVGKEWYFLAGLEVPMVGPLPFQTQTWFQVIKNF